MTSGRDLTEREKCVIDKMYRDGYSYSSISKRLGICKAVVGRYVRNSPAYKERKQQGLDSTID